ncbi:hypothetical protein BJ170DRAFT_722250 [Xylariales sp. AK1849]|nr:hypothetical protein BJ170DRAFT_722250 [Xylariales sp. AK1849]
MGILLAELFAFPYLPSSPVLPLGIQLWVVDVVIDVSRPEATGFQVVYFGGGYLLFSSTAAEVMKRRGHKFKTLLDISLYSIGAIMFCPTPTAHFPSAENDRALFGGFCACKLVICGLATRKTVANSYAVVNGNPATASAPF